MNARDERPHRLLPEDLMLPRDTSRSVVVMMLRAREAVMSRFRPVLAAHDLSEQQWRVLRVLGEVCDLEAREVAARASLLPPSLTRILRSLEERGLVARRHCASDRRRLFLSITPSGFDLVVRLTAEGSGSYADLVERFGRERLDQLLDMLTDLSKLGGKEAP